MADTRRLRASLAFTACLVLGAFAPAQAQVTPLDTLAAPQPLADSLTVADSQVRVPTRPAPRPVSDSDLTAPLTFSASDSLVLVFSDSLGDRGRLVGSTQITYDDVTLDAYALTMLLDRDEVVAEGLRADTGWVGRPQFEQGDDLFTGDRLAYNLRTERGRVVGAQTTYDEGGIRADVVKVDADGTLYIEDGLYTTCPCVEDPSYSLRSGRMKVVNRNWIYTGPIQLYLFNIPAPLWLPFGFLPAQEGRRSGPLAPQYGEDSRGFFLKDWGWYFALSDYLDLQLRGGVWTTGSVEATGMLRYNRRYRYDGWLELAYARQRNGESGDPNFQVSRSSRIAWVHDQDLSPTASFDANVDLTTQSYLRTLSDDYADRARQTASSTVGYQKRWTNAGRRLSLELKQSQVFSTEQADLTFPSLSFTQSQRTPFKRDNRAPGAREAWYEKLTYSYSLRLTNRFQFRPLDDDILEARGDSSATDISWYQALFDTDAYRRATGDDEPFDFQAVHSVPISATFTLQRIPLIGRVPINLTPSLDYTETWFIRSEEQSVDTSGTIVSESVPDFVALRQFTTSVGANTTFYGVFPLRVGPYDGVRHTVRPSVRFSYTPDFGMDRFGYTRTVTDTAGVDQTYPIVSGVTLGRRQRLALSLDNIFETKRITPDTAATGAAPRPRTVQLFRLNASTSYDFAADDFRLGTIALTARTKLLGQVDLNARATLSPYAFVTDSLGQSSLVDDLLVRERGLRIARLTQITITGNTNLASARQQGASRPSQLGRAQPFGQGTGLATNLDGQPDDVLARQVLDAGRRANDVVDFAIPWSLRASFTYGISKPFDTTNRTAVVNLSGDLSLTPRWKLNAQTGYDFERRELSTTRLDLYRDFDCWQMRINWTPFGLYQSYGFELQVKSGQLRELLRIRQPRQDIQGRFGSLLN